MDYYDMAGGVTYYYDMVAIVWMMYYYDVSVSVCVYYC
jgi:hypothetical protein